MTDFERRWEITQERIFALRNILQEWGLAADELPVWEYLDVGEHWLDNNWYFHFWGYGISCYLDLCLAIQPKHSEFSQLVAFAEVTELPYVSVIRKPELMPAMSQTNREDT